MFKFNVKKCLGAIQYLNIEPWDENEYYYYKHSYILLIADTLSVQETQSPVVGGTYRRYQPDTPMAFFKQWHLQELKNLNIEQQINYRGELSDKDMECLKRAKEMYYASKHERPENLHELTLAYAYLDSYKLLGYTDLDNLNEQIALWNF